MNNHHTYNHLFILGAQRSGSTYLYHLLDDHPEIQMSKPVRPEPKFFLQDEAFKRGYQYYLSQFFNPINPSVKYLGEKSTSYIDNTYILKRIKTFPISARFLIILRNPVDRAISNYKFSLQHGLENRSLTEVFIDQKPPPSISQNTSVDPFAYIERSRYEKYLHQWKKLLSEEQLQICILEQLRDQEAEVQSLYEWLGIKKDFIPNTLSKPANKSKPLFESDNNLLKVKQHLYKKLESTIFQTEELLQKNINEWYI